jgi:hypothetical protein
METNLKCNRIFALCYRFVALVLCLFGVLSTVGVLKGRFNGEMLLFYTTESNVLVLVMFAVLLGKTIASIKNSGIRGPSSYCERLSATVALAISVTMLIFWLLLAPTITDRTFLMSYLNLQIHLFTPLLMLFDYFFFAVPGKLKKRDPWLFALVPFAYFVQALVLGFAGYTYNTMGEQGRHFPYFFLDFYDLGIWVLAYVSVILVLFAALAYLMLWLDHKRARRP